MPTKTKKLKTTAAEFVPATDDDAVATVAHIGQLQRERTRLETAMNDELARVREKWETKARPLADSIDNMMTGVQMWAEAHRLRLTRDGKVKTVKLASGEISWRMRPPSVAIRGKDAVLEILKKLRKKAFIRVKEEINKDAILNDPDAVKGIKGISIIQKEDFSVTPFETELEESR